MKLESLQRAREVATVIGVLAVPIVVVYLQNHTSQATSQESVRQQYVATAIGILQKPPAADRSDEGLRRWAAGLLSRTSPEPITDALKEQLVSGQVQIAPTVSLTASPSMVPAGGSTVLQWTTTNGAACPKPESSPENAPSDPNIK